MKHKRRLVSDSEEEDAHPKSKVKKVLLSDDEEAGPSEKRDEGEEIAETQPAGNEVVPDVSDDSDDDVRRNDGR